MGVLVQVKTGYTAIALPPLNVAFNAFQTTTLTDAEFASLPVQTLNALSVLSTRVANPPRTKNAVQPTSLADVLQQAKAYTDSAVGVLSTSDFDSAGSANSALQNANLYTDGKIAILPGVYVPFGPNPPANHTPPIYIDTNTVPPTLKGWDGTSWITVSSPIITNTIVDNGDGTVSLANIPFTDNLDGTESVTVQTVVDNGNGTLTLTA